MSIIIARKRHTTHPRKQIDNARLHAGILWDLQVQPSAREATHKDTTLGDTEEDSAQVHVRAVRHPRRAEGDDAEGEDEERQPDRSNFPHDQVGGCIGKDVLWEDR